MPVSAPPEHVLAGEAQEHELEIGRRLAPFQHRGIADRANAAARYRADGEDVRIDVDASCPWPPRAGDEARPQSNSRPATRRPARQ